MYISVRKHIPNIYSYLAIAILLAMALRLKRQSSPRQKLWKFLLTRYLPLLTLIIFAVSLWNIYFKESMKEIADTLEYIKQSEISLSSLDFWLFGKRLFVTPLILKVFQKNWTALSAFFIIFYVFSSLIFIFMITRFFPRAEEKILSCYLLLLLFLNQQFMSLWLNCVLSEIPAISITLILLAACGFSYLHQKRPDAKHNLAWLLIAVNLILVCFFSFSRDTNLYFLPVLLVFYLFVFKEFAYRILITIFLVFVFSLHLFSLRQSGRWKLPLANIIMQNILPNEGLRRLFQSRYNLPPDDLIMSCSGKYAYQNVPGKEYIVNLQSSRQANADSPPRDWVSRYGMQAYTNYLITHIGTAISGWIEEWDIYNSDLWKYAEISKVKDKKLNPFLFSFPGNVSFFLALLIFLFGIFHLKENPLILLTLLHAMVIGFIAYNGDAQEWDRHYQQASMTLKISFLLFVLYLYSKFRNWELKSKI